jgi:hypothetical protein
MVISADFKKQQQYFDKKNIALSKYGNIALSFYRNIVCENRPSDAGLRETFKLHFQKSEIIIYCYYGSLLKQN